MNLLLAIVIGGLYASALYLMMRRNTVKLIIGLALLGQGTNLLIFTAAGLTRAEPPLIDLETQQPMENFADPLPQALILTAIVIGFAVLAFALVLIHRTHQVIGLEDLDDVKVRE
ncbi:MAG TPA: Na+/H+ antiporter subunit C [Clostridia bacterium]|nr:Na+/H+ antiporter subunit C [Clostridia bacterium]